MTRTGGARLAGATYLLYFVFDVPALFLGHRPLTTVLALLGSVNALVLGVALYVVTRDEDSELALLGMICRAGEGVLGAAGAGLEKGALFFAVGSTIFCWLLLRGRMIPQVLAWLGLAASVLLVIVLPLQLGGVIHGAAAQVVWIPMAAFEIPLGFWFLVKGVRPYSARRASAGSM